MDLLIRKIQRGRASGANHRKGQPAPAVPRLRYGVLFGNCLPGGQMEAALLICSHAYILAGTRFRAPATLGLIRSVHVLDARRRGEAK